MEPKPKRAKWGPGQEAHFVDLWREKADELRGNRKNSHIHAEMANAMSENGFLMTASEVKAKIQNLTAKYKKEKSSLGTGASPSTWPLFDEINEILSSSKFVNCENLIEESFTFNDNTIYSMEDVMEWPPETSSSLPSSHPQEKSNPQRSSASPLPTSSARSSPQPADALSRRAAKNRNKFQFKLLETINESNEGMKEHMNDMKKKYARIN